MRTNILFLQGSTIIEKCALIDIREVLIFNSCTLTSEKNHCTKKEVFR